MISFDDVLAAVDGELPAVRIGRQWRFKRADLDQWVKRQTAN